MWRRCLFSLGWPPFWWWCHNKNMLWGRYFITSTSLGLVRSKDWIGLVWIVRSVATGQRRWMLVALVLMLILFWLSQTWLVTFRYRNRCFLVKLCCLIVSRLNLEVATKMLLYSAGKNIGVVLVPYHTWKHVPSAISSGMDIC